MKGKFQMAKYKHTKITTDKVQIEGILDTSAMTVDIDGDTVNIKDELASFDGKSISITFVEKTEEDIEDNSEG